MGKKVNIIRGRSFLNFLFFTLSFAIPSTSFSNAFIFIGDDSGDLFSYDFGTVGTGTSLNKTLTVRNQGFTTVSGLDGSFFNGSDFSFTGSSGYPGDGGDCGSSLASGASCLIEIKFTPSSASSFDDQVNITYTSPVSDQGSLQLLGAGEDSGGLSFAEGSSYDFGAVSTSSSSSYDLTLENNGSNPVALSLSDDGTLGGAYEYVGGSYPGGATASHCGSSLNPGSNCTLSVVFSPTAAQIYESDLGIDYTMNGVSKNATIGLQGFGNSGACPFLPKVDSISPNPLNANTTTSITLTGCNFQDIADNIDIPDLTVSNVNVVSQEQMTFDVTTTSTVDSYDLVLKNQCGTNTMTDEIVVADSCKQPGVNTSWVRIRSDANDVTTGVRSLAKGPSPSNSWSNAASFEGLTGDIELNFTLDANTGNTPYMIGLDSSDPNANFNTIDYAIYFLLRPGTYMRMYIYENGSYRTLVTSDVQIGDTFSVKRTGTTVTYYRNGGLVYTSTVPSTNSTELVFDSSIYHTASFWSGSATMGDIEICNQ